MKNMAKRGKMVVKKWVFGVEIIRVGNQSRKAKWHKMQVFFLKLNMSEGVKD